MKVHSTPVTAARLEISHHIQLAVRLDWEHNTAIAMLDQGSIDSGAEYIRRSLHTRIERVFHLQTLYQRDLDATLALPPEGLDPARLRVWRAMKMNTHAIERRAACSKVIRGDV